jgi:hypothetical protein
MRATLTLFAALVVTVGPSLAQAPSPVSETVTVSIPIFSQLVVFKVPKGWKPAHETKEAGHYLLEHIPADQTVQNWREMITVQGFQGLATRANAHPRGLINLLGTSIQSKCKENFIGQSYGDGKLDGADVSIALFGCGKLSQDQPGGLKAGESEVALYVALKGTNDMYVIHKSVRGEGMATNEYPRQQLGPWLIPLQPVKLCDRSEPQAQCWERPQR